MRMKDHAIDERILIDSELQRRADVEEETQIDCDDCRQPFWWDELHTSPRKFEGDRYLCNECLTDRHTAAIDAVSEDGRYDH